MSKRWKASFLAIVPGLGHLYLGRCWRGLFVFALFAIAANGACFAIITPPSEMRENVLGLCLTAAAAMWAYSIFHVAHLSRRFQTKALAERKAYPLKRGLARYVAGAFDAAQTELLAVLKLDPMDTDARFHLAMTHKALGQKRKALKAFKRCLADDLDRKWEWEIKRELEKIRHG